MAVAAPGVMVPRRKWVKAGRCGGGQQTITSMQAAQFTTVDSVSMSCVAVGSRSWQCVQVREVPTIPGRVCLVLRRGGGARKWTASAERREQRAEQRVAENCRPETGGRGVSGGRWWRLRRGGGVGENSSGSQ
jgi:hypothetical protein